VRSWTIGAWEDKPAMTIWMDGRSHPGEYDLHTRSGFTTGRWEGNTLVARTTHLKAGLLRRVGAPVSPVAVPPIGPPCITTFEGVDAGAGVPYYLPEKNPFVGELTTKYGIPRDAVLGMPERLYPEYRKKLSPPGR